MELGQHHQLPTTDDLSSMSKKYDHFKKCEFTKQAEPKTHQMKFTQWSCQQNKYIMQWFFAISISLDLSNVYTCLWQQLWCHPYKLIVHNLPVVRIRTIRYDHISLDQFGPYRPQKPSFRPQRMRCFSSKQSPETFFSAWSILSHSLANRKVVWVW